MLDTAIFDVDGTLTHSSVVDADCYAGVLKAVFGIAETSTNWNVYSDVTDSGILSDVVESHVGRAPTVGERQTCITRLLDCLAQAHRDDSRCLTAVPGAAAFVARLRASGWRLAIATGAWAASARAKLEYAGIDGIPLASADDARSRRAILERALSRVGHAREMGSGAVAFGDAVWDVRAALELGIPLIGVGSGARARELETAGAFAVIEDYRDASAVEGLMTAAVNENAA